MAVGDGYEGGFEMRVGLHAVHLGGFDVLAQRRHLGAKLLHQLARGRRPGFRARGYGAEVHIAAVGIGGGILTEYQRVSNP